MADEDPSVREIRLLHRILNPKSGTKHKDRIKRIEKFKQYLTSDPTNTPEFYDDDLPWLFHGQRITNESADINDEYGLLHACGAPSSEHTKALKRSAGNAMELVKFLVLDFEEMVDGKPLTASTTSKEGEGQDEEPELNAFGHALCTCTPEQLRCMNLDLHVRDSSTSEDARSGAKEDACNVIVLLMTRHLAEDGETPEPLNVEELLPDTGARMAFDRWLSKQPKGVQQKVRKAEIAAGSRFKSNLTSGEDGTGTQNPNEPMNVEDFLRFEHQKHNAKQKKLLGEVTTIPTTWAQTEMALEKKAEELLALNAVDATKEKDAERERKAESKARKNRMDPLALRGKDFDLLVVNNHRNLLIQEQLRVMEKEEYYEEEYNKGYEQMLNLENRREAFLRMLELSEIKRENAISKTKKDVNEEKDEEEDHYTDFKVGSILPTDPDFDPMLFLSLVHGNASFKNLRAGLEQLSGKQDNAAQTLVDLVKTNFELFAKCANGSINLMTLEGEDDAAVSSNTKRGKKTAEDKTMTVAERLERIDKLSELCSSQAKRSFKPLVENTYEVRKTQSALAVLQRSRPLLQVPTLMRQHLEAGRISAAIKAYRRISVIDEDCNIELLSFIKEKATDIARDMKRDLELALGNKNLSVELLLDNIRDLNDLNELNVLNPNEGDDNDQSRRIVKNNSPAQACLLLQTTHFESLVDECISHADYMCTRIFEGDSSVLKDERDEGDSSSSDKGGAASDNDTGVHSTSSSSSRSKRWRYDILEARVICTTKGVTVVKEWLPRLLRIAVVARDAEKRATLKAVKTQPETKNTMNSLMSHISNAVKQARKQSKAYNLFEFRITPVVTRLVQHAAFCALGCGNRRKDDKKVPMTFGKNSPENLKALLRTPLPPKESTFCTTELAQLFDILTNCADTVESIRPKGKEVEEGEVNVFEDSTSLAEEAVISVERRRCIFAFDVCARTCYRRAVASGTFDGEALFLTLQRLSEEITRTEECVNEIEKGCQLVVRRCCEGLVEYVRDKGDSARLKAVAECADALTGRIPEVIREISYLTNGQCEAVEEALVEDILALESTLWHEYLESVRKGMMSEITLNWMELLRPENTPTKSSSSVDNNEDGSTAADPEEPPALSPKAEPPNPPSSPTPTKKTKTFPGYLSTSLLAIVRCRANVERALGESTIRKTQDTTYLHLAMATACDSVLDAISSQINTQLQKIQKTNASDLADELQFLTNTLRTHLSRETWQRTDTYIRILNEKAGGERGSGPDGLAAIEELERLGRVYVLCLGD